MLSKVIPDRDLLYCVQPRFYRPAWRRVEYRETVFLPLGLHWIARGAFRVWSWTYRWRPSALERKLQEAYDAGLKDGRKASEDEISSGILRALKDGRTPSLALPGGLGRHRGLHAAAALGEPDPPVRWVMPVIDPANPTPTAIEQTRRRLFWGLLERSGLLPIKGVKTTDVQEAYAKGRLEGYHAALKEHGCGALERLLRWLREHEARLSFMSDRANCVTHLFLDLRHGPRANRAITDIEFHGVRPEGQVLSELLRQCQAEVGDAAEPT